MSAKTLPSMSTSTRNKNRKASTSLSTKARTKAKKNPNVNNVNVHRAALTRQPLGEYMDRDALAYGLGVIQTALRNCSNAENVKVETVSVGGQDVITNLVHFTLDNHRYDLLLAERGVAR